MVSVTLSREIVTVKGVVQQERGRKRMVDGPEDAGYRLDDLARAAGVTVRNVRAYAERGLLPPPRRAGRVNLYDETHLARLRLIGRLLERGYTVAHIADFIAAWEGGHDLGQTLGLEAALLAPSSRELPEELGRDELDELFGAPVEEAALDRAIELGLLSPVGDRYRVHRPRLLRAGAELIGIGMPLSAVLDLAARMQAQVASVAETFVSTVAGHILEQHPAGWRPTDEEIPQLVALVERLRPLARVAVDTELADSLDTELQNYVGDWLSTFAAQVGKRAG
jgi:DNA-binding transcriptional MerR regulator